MATPVRYPSGFTQDAPFQPLAHIGVPNPFFYHVHADDFNVVDANVYTTTVTTAGTVAGAAGDGGTALFTTNATTPLVTDIAALQLKTASFALIPATSTTAGKKTAFLTRIQVSDAVNTAFNVGLMNTTATPFAPTDGVYFTKVTGAANNLTLVSNIGSVTTTVAIPTAAYTLTNNTYIDLGIYVDAKGNVGAYVGTNMVGLSPQSGTGSTNANRGTSAVLALPGLTSVVLNPTLAIQSGSATSKTALVDFVLAARER